jgi:hypothetical protein
MAERVYTYFGINYGTDATPQTVQLGAGSPVLGETYEAAWRHGTKSMEANDGIGLPGSGNYGCGSQTAQNSAAYIG